MYQSIYLNVLTKDKTKIEETIKDTKEESVTNRNKLNNLTNELEFINHLIVAEKRRIREMKTSKMNNTRKHSAQSTKRR